MPQAKHKPPSRERYEANNPTISFRASKELRAKLKKVMDKTGKSYADIMKDGLGMQTKSEEKAYKKGYQAGLKQVQMEQFSAICPWCNREIWRESMSLICKLCQREYGLIK